MLYSFIEVHMENQMNVGSQNTQQIGQNPVNQPVIPPEKPKTNYLLIGGIILACFVIFGFGGYLLGKQSSSSDQSTNNIQNQTTPTETPATNPPTSSPTTTQQTGLPSTPVKEKASLVSTQGWRMENIDNLSLKLPSSAIFTKANCYNSYEYCYTITKHDENHLSPPVSISIKTYQGGSRRQEAELDPNTLDQYSFKERLYGSIDGLDALFICKIKECTAFRNIVFVVDGKLVKVMDGVYKQGSNSTILESAVTNTIISSFTTK